MFVSGSRQLKNPRDEHYWDMLMTSFCPNWQCVSLTMLLAVAMLAMFVAEAIYGINRSSSADLLEISRDSLLKLGANYGPLVLEGQVYRLLSAIFVHLDLLHLVGNLLSTLVLVSRIEHTFGPLRTLTVFLVSGIAGNIFSLAVDSGGFANTLKAGASTSLYGMIGVILGYLIINWRGLELIGEVLRCTMVCLFMFMLLFVLLFTPGSSGVVAEVDNLGHLGGFLGGIWVSAVGTPIICESRETILRLVFLGLLVSQLLGSFLGFYLSH